MSPTHCVQMPCFWRRAPADPHARALATSVRLRGPNAALALQAAGAHARQTPPATRDAPAIIIDADLDKEVDAEVAGRLVLEATRMADVGQHILFRGALVSRERLEALDDPAARHLLVPASPPGTAPCSLQGGDLHGSEDTEGHGSKKTIREVLGLSPPLEMPEHPHLEPRAWSPGQRGHVRWAKRESLCAWVSSTSGATR